MQVIVIVLVELLAVENRIIAGERGCNVLVTCNVVRTCVYIVEVSVVGQFQGRWGYGMKTRTLRSPVE